MAIILKKSNHQEELLEELRNGTPEQLEEIQQQSDAANKALIICAALAVVGILIIVLGRADTRIGMLGLVLCLGGLGGLLVSFFASCLIAYRPPRDKIRILEEGIAGEERTAQIVESLPDSYTVYRNIHVSYLDEQDQLRYKEYDMIVVGNTGVTIVETKNYAGHMEGGVKDRVWNRTKVSAYGVEREGTVENPLRQIGFQFALLRELLKQKGFVRCLDSALYLANPENTLELEGQTPVGIFLESEDGQERLRDFILNGKSHLTDQAVHGICLYLDGMVSPPRSYFEE